MEQAADEVRRLKSCIDDLAGVLGLRAIWSGGEASKIVSALLDVLVATLRLDFAYVRLQDPISGAPIESVRLDGARNPAVLPPEIGCLLDTWLRDVPHTAPLRVPNPMGGGDVSIVPVRLGLQDEMGILVAGSGRADFPLQTERLLLTVAADQAAIGLHEGQRLTQRARELVTANEELNREITERRRAEESLRVSEAHFRSLTELSSDWYWQQDEDLRFTFLSGRGFHLGGYPVESSIGKTRWELANVTPLSSSWAEHQAVLAARQPFRDLEFSRVSPDGSIRYLSSSGEPIFDEHGRFKGYQGIGRDITDRKRAEEALRASEERYALAMHAAGEGHTDWIIPTGEFYVSPRALEIAGLPPGTTISGARRMDRQVSVPPRRPRRMGAGPHRVPGAGQRPIRARDAHPAAGEAALAEACDNLLARCRRSPDTPERLAHRRDRAQAHRRGAALAPRDARPRAAGGARSRVRVAQRRSRGR